MDASALRDVGHELNELRPDLIDADDDELREVGPLQVGRELGHVRDLLLQVDGEPMEVVDDVAARRIATDDLLDGTDMDGIARGEIFRLLGRVQFAEDVAHAGCRPSVRKTSSSVSFTGVIIPTASTRISSRVLQCSYLYMER